MPRTPDSSYTVAPWRFLEQPLTSRQSTVCLSFIDLSELDNCWVKEDSHSHPFLVLQFMLRAMLRPCLGRKVLFGENGVKRCVGFEVYRKGSCEGLYWHRGWG